MNRIEEKTKQLKQPKKLSYDDFRDEALVHIRNLDAVKLDTLLNKVLMEYNKQFLILNYISPLNIHIGELWSRGDLRISQEHFASAIIANFLHNIRESNTNEPNSPTIIVGCLQGQRHELGALSLAALVSTRGWRVVYLGADVPAEEFASAALNSEAKAIAISVVFPTEDTMIFRNVGKLKLLAHNTPIFLGGKSFVGIENVVDNKISYFFEDPLDFMQKLDNLY